MRAQGREGSRRLGFAGLGLVGLAVIGWGARLHGETPDRQGEKAREPSAQASSATTRLAQAPGRERETGSVTDRSGTNTLANVDVNSLRESVFRRMQEAAAEAAQTPADAITPEHLADPDEQGMREGFAELARARERNPQKPDPELAEGLLEALKVEAAPVERFALINAYLDAVAGIEDPELAKAAVDRLAEASAAPDAVYY
jgi:hypothetical protein